MNYEDNYNGYDWVFWLLMVVVVILIIINL